MQHSEHSCPSCEYFFAFTATSSYLDPHNWTLVASSSFSQKWRGFSQPYVWSRKTTLTRGSIVWRTPQNTFYEAPNAINFLAKPLYFCWRLSPLRHLASSPSFAWIPPTFHCSQPAHRTVGFSPVAERVNKWPQAWTMQTRTVQRKLWRET